MSNTEIDNNDSVGELEFLKYFLNTFELAGDSGVTADFEVDFENAFGNKQPPPQLQQQAQVQQQQAQVEQLQRQQTFDLASLNSSLTESIVMPTLFDTQTPAPPPVQPS